MENFNDIYEKAGVLMQGALKKYSEGDFEGGDKERQQANELYDLAEKHANMRSSNDTMLYGENRNFGIIYSIVEANTKDWFLKKKNRKALLEVKKLFDSNKILKEELNIYNAFNNIQEGIDAKQYVTEALDLFGKMDKKELKENNQKLINLIRKYNSNEMIGLPDDKADLYEAIEYVITNNKSVKNVQEYILNESKIIKHLEENVLTKGDIHSVYDEQSLKESSKRVKDIYNTMLNEEERKFIDELLKNNDNVEEAFNSIKNELSESIKKEMFIDDITSNERWTQVLGQINEMKYDKEKGVDNLIKLTEIKKAIM